MIKAELMKKSILDTKPNISDSDRYYVCENKDAKKLI